MAVTWAKRARALAPWTLIAVMVTLFAVRGCQQLGVGGARRATRASAASTAVAAAAEARNPACFLPAGMKLAI
jgi:hypothetical protein